jgi:hypothetical protein
MKLRNLYLPVLTLTAGFLSGCGGASGVYSVAPAPRPELVSNAPQSGRYSVYRAVGFEHDQNPVMQQVWTVSVDRGEQLGFRWEAPAADRYSPGRGLHLVAYAGHQTMDLGTFDRRDMKYAWASSEGDVVGYFQARSMNHTMQTMTLQ